VRGRQTRPRVRPHSGPGPASTPGWGRTERTYPLTIGRATWHVWFKVDDAFWSHPKVIQAGNAAIGLWLRCGSYSAQHLTDGFIPQSIAKHLGSSGLAARLVDVGLWTTSDDPCGYLMHDWADYQPTRATWLTRRESSAQRQRMHREKQQVNGTSHAVTNSAPTRPDPSSPEVQAVDTRGSKP
jgi:hypothetical protein